MANSFINPYAFVSFKEVKKRKNITDLQNEKTYSGSFEYSIELKTPLIIPNTSCDEFGIDSKVSKSYGIYSYENLKGALKQSNVYQPVIPGSEIRGCIRNVYEALTDSCYNLNKDNDLYFSERLDPKKSYKAGILLNVSDGVWDLYAADKYKSKDIDDKNIENYCLKIEGEHYDMFEKVYVSLIDNEFDDISKEENGAEEGYLTIGNTGLKKNTSISVFLKRGAPLLRIKKNDNNYKRLIASISSFIDKNSNCTYKRYLDALKSNKTITIYYENINENFRFSPAQIGRVLFNTSLNDLVGESKYCSNLLCPACLLFGIINDNTSVSSRVRFGDAVIDNYNYDTSKYIDLISGGPKYSNKYFYAKLKDNKADWDNISTIAGRKFYWHHIPNIDSINKKVGSNPSAKIKSRYYYIDNKDLKDNKFTGKVYFNDLTKEEVLMLYKAITLVDDKHCHKLGHGKPFGFGSCNFTITGLYSEELELDEIKNNVDWTNSLNDLELKYILEFNALDNYINDKTIVNYPFNDDPIKEEGFKWFVTNKKSPFPQHLRPLILGNNRVSPVLKGYDSNQVNNKNKTQRNNFRRRF